MIFLLKNIFENRYFTIFLGFCFLITDYFTFKGQENKEVGRFDDDEPIVMK